MIRGWISMLRQEELTRALGALRLGLNCIRLVSYHILLHFLKAVVTLQGKK